MSTTSSVSSTAAASTNASKGLNDGEVAGVAIGCLIAGLIIGTIIGWLIFRSKGQQRYARQRRRSEDRGRLVDHPREANAVPLGISGDPMKLENIILQPTPDQDILSGLRRLEDIIRQHVETVYHLKPVDVEEKALACALADAGYSSSRSGIDIETVAGWCNEIDTRCGALRHVLSNILFSAIDWNNPGPLTLLPESAVAFMSSVRRNEKHRDNVNVMSFAWTRWRTLSALFMHPAPHERTPLDLSEPDIRDQAEALAKALDPVLHYFVAPDDESQHQQVSGVRHTMALNIGLCLSQSLGSSKIIVFHTHLVAADDCNLTKMTEYLGPVGSLTNVTYHVIKLLIKCKQASDEVRRSLELVRTCDRDLQHLISLREEHLDILERKPIELVRVNSIIEDAHNGLLEVGRIVEKCRPEAQKKGLPFCRRGLWVMFDAEEFNSQVPVVNSHHQSVLTEIQFLRLIGIHAPPPIQINKIEAEPNIVQKRRIDIGNVNLLGSLIGVRSVTTSPIPQPQANTADCLPYPSDSDLMPPLPPSYSDASFVATSSTKHINILDIQERWSPYSP
ncbi:unnamed protein product [Fusarium graminearum]|uniref:Chromosome 3, complete genome n=1 Tax=Gibberella zeae (strain ATCC MYA-4620 / CBS 123657 / FGSC 9075 / NRRL 31084 / PH-1) TaxID=229533 RepID=A0A1C3YJP8_GIBZE|nr:unnamed protein product [Fusarium graminearum]